MPRGHWLRHSHHLDKSPIGDVYVISSSAGSVRFEYVVLLILLEVFDRFPFNASDWTSGSAPEVRLQSSFTYM
jgi:hypothetical protein